MVRIITDSTCDLSLEYLAEIGVICVPLSVHFGEDVYIDGVNLTAADFYKKLRTEGVTPTTAQPNPHAFEEAFRACLDKDEDVLCLLVAEELSGTMQSAYIAKEAVQSERIRIIDTRSACLPIGLLVRIAADKANVGADMDSLYNEMMDLRSRARVFAAVETLEYLKKGGRLSGTAAMIGTMLNLHPILTVEDGKVLNIDKVRGKKKMYSVLLDWMKKYGVDEEYPIVIGHGGSEENFQKLIEASQGNINMDKVFHGAIGPVVGTYTGPGVVAIGFITAKK